MSSIRNLPLALSLISGAVLIFSLSCFVAFAQDPVPPVPSFAPPSSVPPVAPALSNVQITDITKTGATVSWNVSPAATGQVEYGLTTAYGSATPLETGLLTTHSQSISSLTAGTVYHYRIRGTDSEGDEVVPVDRTFTTLFPVPTASLTANPTSIIAGQSSTLTWSSTNATSCTGTGFATGGVTGGTATVSPTVTTTYSVDCSGAGGTATANAAVTVIPVLTATASANPTSGVVPLAVTFSGSATGGNGTYGYSWNFGDGSAVSTVQNPSHTYSSAGTYPATLTVTSGTQTKTAGVTITVNTPTPVTRLNDGFESALNWTRSGDTTWYTGSPKVGTHSVRLRKTGSITKTVSLAGYKDATVSFKMGAYSLDSSSENLQMLYYNGSSWVVLAQINNGSANENNQLNAYTFPLPATVNGKANFQIRFKLNSSATNDYGFVDDVVVTAMAM